MIRLIKLSHNAIIIPFKTTNHTKINNIYNYLYSINLLFFKNKTFIYYNHISHKCIIVFYIRIHNFSKLHQDQGIECLHLTRIRLHFPPLIVVLNY
jgi:hypothetical protein